MSPTLAGDVADVILVAAGQAGVCEGCAGWGGGV